MSNLFHLTWFCRVGLFKLRSWYSIEGRNSRRDSKISIKFNNSQWSEAEPSLQVGQTNFQSPCYLCCGIYLPLSKILPRNRETTYCEKTLRSGMKTIRVCTSHMNLWTDWFHIFTVTRRNGPLALASQKIRVPSVHIKITTSPPSWLNIIFQVKFFRSKN